MRFESELQKELYYRSQIYFCYFGIQLISGHMNKPQSPLEAMVDKATGFDKANVKERIKEVRSLIRTIIRCKGKMGYDNSGDKEFLHKLKSL